MLRMTQSSSATARAIALAAVVGFGAFAPTLTRGADAPVGNGKATEAVEDLSRLFRNVGKEIEPSVVSIKVHKTIEPTRRNSRGGPTNEPFFRHPFGPGAPDGSGGDDEEDGSGGIPGFPNMPFGGGGEQIGEGSGVIMAVDGNTAYIVTNNHVAGDADEMEISLYDGRNITNGKLVGKDPRTDLAVVKIEASNLKAAKWGDSDQLDKGDWVLAFGSPFGYVGSMTHGIVSATNRTDLRIIPQGYEAFIQIDAPINPGNSGGPLVNIHGEVVGINTAIASRTGGFQGIGFAIPANQAKQITSILRDKGKVVRGWLGVGIASVSEPEVRDVAADMGYKGSKGVLVQEIIPNTPATGKLREGDIVTAINGKNVSDSGELRNQIAMMAPGTDVKLDLFRDGKMQNITVKLGDQASNMASMGRSGAQPGTQEPAQSDSPKIGVGLTNLTPELARRFGLDAEQRGAIVSRVVPGSPAARAGIGVGDVITKVGTDAVTNRTEAETAIKSHDVRKGFRMYVMGPRGSRFVFVQAVDKKPNGGNSGTEE